MKRRCVKGNLIKQVGVIGMGRMGAPMALNLLKAGFKVTVHNRTREKCRTAADAGAAVAASPADVAARTDAVLLMLADDAAVKQVVFGKGGLRANGKAGLLVIDSSTVQPGLSQKLAAAFAEKKIMFLDAPVTGSRPQAEDGKLFFLVGGSRAAYERAIPLFEAMGRKHLRLGTNGAGACAKLCNNLAGFVNLAGFCEAMAIGKRYGLAPQQLFEVIRNSGGRSGMADVKGPKILRRDWNADFVLSLASKDMRLGIALAEKVAQRAPLAKAARKIYDGAATNHGSDDVCALYRWYLRERNAE
ncbi:MAG: NAD(P)-dependent oxidoreductase [Verrucomicrobia bacterium]|nr:NAD(P)-dependent oxidoreductase [Verrucomicrobiota bacterium]